MERITDILELFFLICFRTFKESFESLKAVQEKCKKLINTVEKSGKLTKVDLLLLEFKK